MFLSSLIIHHLVMITYISYEIIRDIKQMPIRPIIIIITLSLPKLINIAPL